MRQWQRLWVVGLLAAMPLHAALAQRGRRQPVRAAAPAASAQAAYDSTLLRGLRWRNIGPFRGGRAVAVTGVRGHPRTYYMGATGGGAATGAAVTAAPLK